jgi:hypothetical protein
MQVHVVTIATTIHLVRIVQVRVHSRSILLKTLSSELLHLVRIVQVRVRSRNILHADFRRPLYLAKKLWTTKNCAAYHHNCLYFFPSYPSKRKREIRGNKLAQCLFGIYCNTCNYRGIYQNLVDFLNFTEKKQQKKSS